MRAGSLQREITEGRRDEKKGRGRARQKLIDWMLKDGYGKPKKAQQREEWSRMTFSICRKADNLKKENEKSIFSSG